MTYLHPPTDLTGLSLDELETELAAIGQGIDAARAAYLADVRADATATYRTIFRLDPDHTDRYAYHADAEPCPTCGDTGWVEDEEGFLTTCDHPQPWDDDGPLF